MRNGESELTAMIACPLRYISHPERVRFSVDAVTFGDRVRAIVVLAAVAELIIDTGTCIDYL